MIYKDDNYIHTTQTTMSKIGILAISLSVVLLIGIAIAYHYKGRPSLDVKHASPEQIQQWLKDALNGNAEAQSSLGLSYRYGDGVKQSYKESAKWYRMAAEQGDDDAQFVYASSCLGGLGVDQDGVEALKWLRRAALHGNEGSKTILSNYTVQDGEQETNSALVTLKLTEAVKRSLTTWASVFVDEARKAAEHGDALAQYRLGYYYNTGFRGIEKNQDEAVKWYRKAAEQGNADAQYALGACYVEGVGVTKDLQIAYGWILVAKSGGSKAASSYAGNLEQSLTPSEVREATTWAKEWKPQGNPHK